MKEKSLATNYIYHTLFQVFNLLTPLITTPYISRVLRPEGIGQYSYASTLVQYFVILGNLGFSTYGQIEIAKYNDDFKKCNNIFWEIFITRSVVFGISIIAYFIFILSFQNNNLMFILTGLMLSGILDISWLFFGMNDFKSVSIRNIAVKIMSIIGIFTLVKSNDDVELYTLILTLSTLCGSCIMWIGVKNFLHYPNLNELKFRRHLKPAIEFFLPNIATTIYTMADKTMIGMITGSDIQNGYYEQAHKLEQVLVQVLLSISVVYKTKMAKLFECNYQKEIQNNIDKAVNSLLLLAFPMCFGVIGVSRDLTGCFLGLEYLDCISLIKIFAVLLVVISISNCMSNMYLIVTNLQNKFRKGTYIGAIINVICNIILIPKFKAAGAAVASVISEIIMLVFFYYYSKKYYNINRYKARIVKYGCFAFFMLCVIEIEKVFLKAYVFNSLVFEIFSGGIIYIGLLILTKDKLFVMYMDILQDKIKIFVGK